MPRYAFQVKCQIDGEYTVMPLVVMRPETGITTEETGQRGECFRNAICHSQNFGAVCSVYHESGELIDRISHGYHQWSLDPGKIDDLIKGS